LPPELSVAVMVWLDARSVARVGMTCRALSDAAQEPMLWRILLLRDFPSLSNSQEGLWKELYVRNYRNVICPGEPWQRLIDARVEKMAQKGRQDPYQFMEEDYQMCVILRGINGCGKKSLRDRFSQGTFKERVTFGGGIGVDFTTRRIDLDRLHITVTCVADSSWAFPSLMFVKKAVVTMICFSAVDKSFFEQVFECLGACEKNSPHSIVVLVATKADLLTESTYKTIEDKKRFAEERGIPFFMTSAKTGEGVEELFLEMAKQCVEKLERLLHFRYGNIAESTKDEPKTFWGRNCSFM